MSSPKKTPTVQKKIVLILLASSLFLIGIYAAFSVVSANIDEWLYYEREPGNAVFPYEPNFDEDIFKDKEYMELDRLINYTEEKTGISLSIDDTNYTTYNDTVTFMYEFINSILHGDVAFYNNCFNELYLESAGKQQPFTKQKIYDIEFCVFEEGTDSESGKSYVKLWLDYKIFKNNVTLRTDIGSDVCRRQYLTLVKDTNGNLKIQAIQTQIVHPIRTLNVGNAVILSTFTVLFVVGIAVAVIFAVKTSKRTASLAANESSSTEEIE